MSNPRIGCERFLGLLCVDLQVKEVVSREEAAANVEASKVKAIETDCLTDLDKAMPMLDEAIKALDTLKPADITEVPASPWHPLFIVTLARLLLVIMECFRF